MHFRALVRLGLGLACRRVFSVSRRVAIVMPACSIFSRSCICARHHAAPGGPLGASASAASTTRRAPNIWESEIPPPELTGERAIDLVLRQRRGLVE